MSHDRSPRGNPSFANAFWGRRGVVKSGSIWFPLAVFISSSPSSFHAESFPFALGCFIAVAGWAMVSIFVNDLADARQDRIAGKSRWICTLDLKTAVALICLFIAAGTAGLLLFSAPQEVFGIYFFSLSLGLAYSLMPFRFKSAGGWGIAAYALACVGAYVILPGIWLRGRGVVIFMLAVAVFLDKTVNLLFHQVLDHDVDRLAGVSTLAVRWGISRTLRRMRPVAFFAALVMLTASAVSVSGLERGGAGILGTAAVGWICCMILIGIKPWGSAAPSELTKKLPLFYLSSTLVVFRLLPLLLLARLSLIETVFRGLTVGAGILIGLDVYYSYRYRLP